MLEEKDKNNVFDDAPTDSTESNDEECYRTDDDINSPADIKEAKNISENKGNQSQSLISTILDYAEIFVFAVCFVIVIFSFALRLCKVVGPSMERTLFENEMLIVSDIAYTPEREDIIVFHQTGGVLNEPVVKRVIATEGEIVNIDFDTWTVTVTDENGNETVLDEPYVYLDPYEADRLSAISYPYEVPEGHLFVMGDNRRHSTDSRESLIGPVDERRVLGKVIFRLTPFDKFGLVR